MKLILPLLFTSLLNHLIKPPDVFVSLVWIIVFGLVWGFSHSDLISLIRAWILMWIRGQVDLNLSHLMNCSDFGFVLNTLPFPVSSWRRWRVSRGSGWCFLHLGVIYLSWFRTQFFLFGSPHRPAGGLSAAPFPKGFCFYRVSLM